MHKLFLVLFFLIFSGCSTQKNRASYGALLEEFKYPFEVKYFAFTSQNQTLKMAYMDLMPATEKENAKTVVLLHGKNFSGYYWERVAKELLQLNYRVIIPDQIGFGKSSKPNSYQHSFGQFSINTNKLLDSLGVSNYELVGHSMGGMLAITNAYLNPRKVSKLILINPIGLENYLDYSKFKDPDFFFEREKAKTPQKIRAYQKKELL